MILSNKKRVVLIKRIFNIIMLTLVLSDALLFWLNITLWAFIILGIILIGLTCLQFLQINYIYYNSKESNLVVRYHAATSLFGGKYESIEFDKSLLWKINISRSFGFADLTIVIRTQRGILEYPDVSLVGLTSIEIDLLEDDLNSIVKKNHEPHQR